MKKAICIISAVILIIISAAGCGKSEQAAPVTEVKVMLPVSEGTQAIVEGEAVITTQLYLLGRAYIEKLEKFDTDSFNADEFRTLLAEAQEAFRIAESFCGSFEYHAEELARTEKELSKNRKKSSFEQIPLQTAYSSSPFLTVTYAAEEKSPAIQFAEDITKAFDSAKNGQKLKAVAELYGTDIKKAKIMFEQAQAILEGAAHEEQAEFENKCYEAAVETKAAASAIGFGVACAASYGTAAGIMQVGGLAFSGVNAFIDTGTAVTIHNTHGEGDEYTAAFERTAEMVAPVSAFFAIGGGIQNIKDIRNPEKAAEIIDNGAQLLLTGLGFARDYVQDGTVIGVSSRIADGYREIIIRAADSTDHDASEEVLLKTGFSEDDIEGRNISAEQIEKGYLGAEADVYIEALRALANPADPLDMDAILSNIAAAFTDAQNEEGIIEATVETAPAEETTEKETEEPVTEKETETEKKTEETEPETEKATEKETADKPKESIAAADAAGTYYFEELEDSAEMVFEAADKSHLVLTDAAAGESITGDYDEKTGYFRSVLSEKFNWYVEVQFTDTGKGIRADYRNVLGDTVTSESSAIKK